MSGEAGRHRRHQVVRGLGGGGARGRGRSARGGGVTALRAARRIADQSAKENGASVLRHVLAMGARTRVRRGDHRVGSGNRRFRRRRGWI